MHAHAHKPPREPPLSDGPSANSCVMHACPPSPSLPAVATKLEYPSLPPRLHAFDLPCNPLTKHGIIHWNGGAKRWPLLSSWVVAAVPLGSRCCAPGWPLLCPWVAQAVLLAHILTSPTHPRQAPLFPQRARQCLCMPIHAYARACPCRARQVR